MLYVGLDIGSKSIWICVLNEDGKVVRQCQARQVDQLMALLCVNGTAEQVAVRERVAQMVRDERGFELVTAVADTGGRYPYQRDGGQALLPELLEDVVFASGQPFGKLLDGHERTGQVEETHTWR